MNPTSLLHASALRTTTLRSKRPVPDLAHFVQRQKALHLYRQIVRETYRIANATLQKEMRQHARTEFERHRGVEDLAHARYLMALGKTEFETMRRYVAESAMG